MLKMRSRSLERFTEKAVPKPDNEGGEGWPRREIKQGVLTENLWPKLFSEAPRCAPLRLPLHSASPVPFLSH
jgi:hypothetical protein